MKIVSALLSMAALFYADLAIAQNVGIGTNTPTEKLHVVGGARITNLSGVGYRLVSSSPTGVLANIADGTLGQVLTTDGAGNYSWASATAPTVDNGLYYNGGAASIRMGGPLVENTTVTQGAFNMVWNLNGTGDFNIQDNATSTFLVRDDGISFFGDDVYWRDVNTAGTNLMILTDDVNDGRLRIMENGATSVDLDANTQFVFNEQGLDRNFRIESDGQNDMFFVDAGTNRIGINTLTPVSPLQFISTGENVWLMQWDNAPAVGAAARFQNTAAGNGNRCLMGTVNYSGSAQVASAVIGISLNNTTIGSGGVGVLGSANNESGNAVQGDLFFTGGYTGWAGYFNADVFSAGTYFGSDRRLKRDINPIESALDIVKQLEPVSYFYDTDKYPHIGFDADRLTYGFIAQDLEQVLPTLVKEKTLDLNSNVEHRAGMSVETQKEEFKVVNYTLMVPILTQAVKEQQAVIENQQEQIDRMEAELQEIKELLQK